MAETEQETTEQEAPAEETTDEVVETEETEDSPADEWRGPTKEEWETQQRYLEFMAQQFIADDDEPDPAAQAFAHLNQRLTAAEQAAAVAVEERGRQKMQKMFTELESKVGSFDHELAEAYAERLVGQLGDPEKAVREGAKRAAAFRKAEREAGIKEYQESLQGGGSDDPDVAAAGEFSAEAPKTVDDVIAKWEKLAHQGEV